MAQIISAKFGSKAVTFNAFGTGKILKNMGIEHQRFLDIKNYGNPNDIIFMSNKGSQPGTTYFTNTDLNPRNTYFFKQEIPKYDEIKDKFPNFENHPAEKMDSLDKAIKVETNVKKSEQLVLKGSVSYDEYENRTASEKFSDMIREDYRKLQKERYKRIFARSKTGDWTFGHWVTIDGNHVFIED